MNTPPPESGVASGELIASWRSRRQRLQTVIAEQTDDPSRWIWAVRLRVLGYLLQRYASGAAADASATPAGEADLTQTSSDAAPQQLAGVAQINQQAVTPLTSASRRREALEKLHQANADRYVAVARRRELDEQQDRIDAAAAVAAGMSDGPQAARLWRQSVTQLSYPERGFKPLSAKLAREQRELVRRDVALIAEILLTPDAPASQRLTEEQIVALLAG